MYKKFQFGFCRDCKHWLSTQTQETHLKNYARDIHPSDGFISAVCTELLKNLDITVSSNHYATTVDSIEVDANFGCAFFEKG